MKEGTNVVSLDLCLEAKKPRPDETTTIENRIQMKHILTKNIFFRNCFEKMLSIFSKEFDVIGQLCKNIKTF
jgi:hypothetical protein